MSMTSFYINPTTLETLKIWHYVNSYSAQSVTLKSESHFDFFICFWPDRYGEQQDIASKLKYF